MSQRGRGRSRFGYQNTNDPETGAASGDITSTYSNGHISGTSRERNEPNDIAWEGYLEEHYHDSIMVLNYHDNSHEWRENSEDAIQLILGAGISKLPELVRVRLFLVE
jgi:hypothetical protein